MAITISYMVHGTTQDNIDNLFSGQHDIELSNPRGIVEAKHLGETIKHKFDIIFVTGLKRSIQTAKLAFPHRCEIVEETLLKECDYGDMNQTSKEGINLTNYIKDPFPNGESFIEVEYRVKKFLDFLKQHYDGKHVAIIAHQTPQLALEVLINNKSWEEAIKSDWRKTKSWRPEWQYILK